MDAIAPVRGSVWLMATIALAIAVSACASLPDDPRSSTQSSYTLRDFDVVYPYDDPGRDGVYSEDRASVFFRANWPDSGFPGYATCVLTLEGTGGHVVGDATFRLISGTDGARGGGVVVPASDKPVAATGSCTDDGTDDISGSGYLFTGPTRIWADSPERQIREIEAPPLSHVEFDVAFEHPGQNPGMRTCYLYVTRADGTEDPPVKYGMLVGERPVVFDVKGEPETIASARVTCGPLEP